MWIKNPPRWLRKCFDELDAQLALLPEFDVSIQTGGHYEIRLRAHQMSDHIAVHVAPLVALSIGQVFQVDVFIGQDYLLISYS